MRIDESFASAAIRISSKNASGSELQAMIPLTPSRVVDRNSSSAGESRWILESEATSTAVEQHIEDLITLIEKNRSAFGALPQDCEVDIWCTVSSPREFIGLALSRNILRRIAALNLELVFGFYRGDDSSTH